MIYTSIVLQLHLANSTAKARVLLEGITKLPLTFDMNFASSLDDAIRISVIQINFRSHCLLLKFTEDSKMVDMVLLDMPIGMDSVWPYCEPVHGSGGGHRCTWGGKTANQALYR